MNIWQQTASAFSEITEKDQILLTNPTILTCFPIVPEAAIEHHTTTG